MQKTLTTPDKYYYRPPDYLTLIHNPICLINLDGPKDGLIEVETCSDAHKACHQEQPKRCQAHVTKVKHVSG